MKTSKVPKWLADEIEELGRSVLSGEVDREEALSTLVDHILDKDADLVRVLVTGYASGKLQAKINARKRETVTRVDQMLSGVFQPGFDEVCSDYWSRETYGPLTPLSELRLYHEEMCRYSANMTRRDDERGQRLIELLAAAGGDENMAWGVAELKRLGITPNEDAAEG